MSEQAPGPPAAQPADPEPAAAPRPPADPVAVAAVVVGAVGIVFFGIACAIVTALLAAEAGKRARADRRPQDNAYLAMALALIDGVVWILLQYRFELPIWVG